MTLERVFLGWDAPALPRAAALLWERYGPDFRALRVALPGRHAARRLEELLLDEADRRGVAEWWPPRIDTIGGATDQLIDADGEPGSAADALLGGRHPVASSLARELAWLRVLRDAAPETLAALTPSAPQGEDLAALGQRLGLAELLRTLHSEVVGEALDFADVARCDAFPPHTREAARWRALATLQQGYRKLLADERLEDPHLRRLDALREGRVHGEGQWVLLGVSELNRLQREILLAAARRGATLVALVVAPEEEAAAFGELGTLLPEAWSGRVAPLPDEAWRIVERPQDQADEAVRALALLGAGRALDEVVVCVVKEELEPSVRRALTEVGSGLRSPVGPLLEASGPWRLLDALGDFLDTRSPESCGELLRHADFEAAHAGAGGAGGAAGGAAITQCEDYLLERLPARMPAGDALPTSDRYRALRDALAFLDAAAGPLLADAAERKPPEIADALRGFLERVYGGREFDRTREAERVCAAALEKLLAALDEVHRLPDGLARAKLRPTALLRVVLRRCAQQAVTPPQRGGAVEQLGWLDLPLDDAPVTVVAGVQQGAVPATRHGDAFLPDTLRARLGMPEQAARDARDLHALCVLHHTRAADGGLRLIAGLQSPDGDPWLPSSLYFRCTEDELAGRAARAFQDERKPAAALGEAPRAPYLPPLGARWEEPAHHSASSLNVLLTSRYAWYLKYVLRLDEADAVGQELDPMRFGNLLHKVLERFGKEEALRDSEDPQLLREALRGFLADVATRRFGGLRRASVALQLLHAERRLDRFAELQAAEARAGWRIVGAEWKPDGDGVVELALEGEPLRLKGTLDRIERNALTGAWRVLDYKSGEQPRGRAQVYAPRKAEWRDVQLPLYRHLAAAFPELRGELQLGYFNLPKSPEDAGIWVGDADDGYSPFDAPTLAAADAVVAEALRGMRAALEARDEAWFREVGDPRDDSLVAVLAGRSYLAAGGDDDEDGGDGFGGAGGRA